MNKEYKSGFVSIIGRPNVGKSTLMNRLIGQKIAITSNKAQTTRNRIQTVYTSDKGQIIFLDTPGINSNLVHLLMVDWLTDSIGGYHFSQGLILFVIALHSPRIIRVVTLCWMLRQHLIRLNLMN